MKKVAILLNIPSPYRSDLFQSINDINGEFEIYTIYQNKNEDNRKWEIANHIENELFLKSKTIKIKRKLDYKYIHISLDLEKKLKFISPDLVIIAEYNPNSIRAAKWCIKNNIKYISWTDGTYNSESNINYLQKKSRKYIVRNANSFIASSTRAMENQILYGAEKEKITISPLTVNINNFLYKKSNVVKADTVKLLFVGRLVEAKGIEFLINTLSKLNREDFELNIIGEGYLLDDLNKQVQSLNLQNKVIFRGYLEGEPLFNYYKQSNVFILPSLSEPYGLVVLEAMCNSLAIICSEFVDSHPDLISEGINGLVFNPLDEKNFKKTLEYLLNNKTLIEQMGNESYKIASQYSIKHSALLFEQAITNELSQRNE